MTKVALIDGDVVAYQCAAAAEDDFEGEVIRDLNGAIDNALHLIDDWTDQAGCSASLVAFSDPEGRNFRKLLGSYKENREGHEKPSLYWDVVAAIRESKDCLSFPWLEGDDVIGIMLTKAKPGRAVAVSIDKDIRTLPGTLFDPGRDDFPWDNSPADAKRFHLIQSMTGDVVDGYKGIPGIGIRKAEEILDNPHRLSLEKRIIKRGKNKGNVETKWRKGGPCGLMSCIHDYCLKHGIQFSDWVIQGQMARILHHDDYDTETGAIRLWDPTLGGDTWLQPKTDK